eukprot:214184-Chlamydomonas_euryale.AAC.3
MAAHHRTQAAADAAADGANLVLVTGASAGLPANEETLQRAKSGQRSGNPIPVLQVRTHVCACIFLRRHCVRQSTFQQQRSGPVVKGCEGRLV